MQNHPATQTAKPNGIYCRCRSLPSWLQLDIPMWNFKFRAPPTAFDLPIWHIKPCPLPPLLPHPPFQIPNSKFSVQN